MIIQGHPVIFVPRTTSTNDLVEEFIEKGNFEDGSIVRTAFQTAGKGMINNSWQSEEGKNLLFSLYKSNLGLKAENQFYLSKAAALSLHDMLTETYALRNVKIKWPNDILVNHNKISGTLIQCGLRNNDVVYSIVGIGLNVNQDTFSDEFNATSLLKERRILEEIDNVLKNLVPKLDHYIKMIREGEFEHLDNLYHSNLFGKDEWLDFISGEKKFKGRIKEVNRSGLLVLEYEDGNEKSFEIKEISPASTRPTSPPTY